jgi:capsular polysaccharide transport system ATP-binding protein
MISGAMSVTSGEILTDGQISFPVGYAGSFAGDMTGAQNTRFVARIYGVDSAELLRYVEDFAELGPSFYLPVRTYSSGMKSRLAFGVSMGIAFDTYLIDEITAVGDASFKRKSKAVFRDRMQRAGALFVSHSIGELRQVCQAGAVIEGGELTYFDDIEEAIEQHLRNCGG